MVSFFPWIHDILLHSGEHEAMQGGGRRGHGTYWKYFMKLIPGEICLKIEKMPHFI